MPFLHPFFRILCLSEGRYIPPHLRHEPRENRNNSEEITRLTRQLKGFLNRLVEEGFCRKLKPR